MLKKGELYKGYSSNLINRIDSHNKGKVKSTKVGRPWDLIYFEAFLTKQLALKEEKFLKSGKGRERLKNLFND